MSVVCSSLSASTGIFELSPCANVSTPLSTFVSDPKALSLCRLRVGVVSGEVTGETFSLILPFFAGSSSMIEPSCEAVAGGRFLFLFAGALEVDVGVR